MSYESSPAPTTDSVKTRAPWALLALLSVLAAGAWRDAAVLLRYPVAVGIDGYYYVLQIDALRGQGHFYFPTRAPLILYALAGLSHLTGDTVLAMKIGAVILHAALCLGIFGIVYSATRSPWLGVLGSALAVASGAHFYMVGEFISNLGAVTFLIWCGWFATLAFRTRRKVWGLLAFACLAGAALSHRSALPLAAILLLSLLLARPLTSAKSPGVRTAALAAVLIIWCAPAILALQPFMQLPAWAQGEFSAVPRLPLSRSAVAEKLLLFALAPATLILVSSERLRRREGVGNLIFGSVALWSMLVTLNPFLNHGREWIGVSWRFGMLAYVQAAILVPGLIWLAVPLRREAIFYVAGLALPLMVWSARDSLPYGMRGEYLSKRAEIVKRLPAYRGQLGPSPLVISPHGEQFVVASVLGVPAQQRWPDQNTYHTIYWLLHGVGPRFVTPSMTVLMPEGGGHMVLAKDDDVRQMVGAISGVERRQLLISNPHLHDYVFGRDKATR
jgi:hypothetical protein